MYIDNEYASAGQKPVYDKAHFIARFEAIPENKWCIKSLQDDKGRKCALGHLGNINSADWRTEESIAFAALFGPHRLGEHIIAGINDGTGFGDTPKSRVLHALSLLPDPVTTDIRIMVGVEQVRVVTKRPAVSISYMDFNDAKLPEPASYSFTVGPAFWKQPVLQP